MTDYIPTPEPTNIERWSTSVDDTLDMQDDRIRVLEKKQNILTIGMVGMALGLVFMGRTTMRLIKGVTEMTQAFQAIPVQAAQAARAAQTAHAKEARPEPPVDETIPPPAPVVEGYDPGPQERCNTKRCSSS